VGHHHHHHHRKHHHFGHRHGGFPFFWILGIFAFFFFAGKFILPLLLIGGLFAFVLPRVMSNMQGQSWGCDFGSSKHKNDEKPKRDFITTPDGERLDVIYPDQRRPGIDEFV
jgi:hypothetical protein